MADGTVLLTGYEPFDDFETNPSEAVAQELDGETVAGHRVVSAVLPVEFDAAADAAVRAIEDFAPDIVVATGLAAGRSAISVERVGINVNDARGTPDNAGADPENERIDPDGADAYFASLPVARTVERLLDRGVPARLSNTAGTHLCNHLLYSLRAHAEREGLELPAGFVHLPATPEVAVRQADDPARGGSVPASMPLSMQVEGVGTVLETAVEGAE
ncbi:pyroglutamyl-peptidase I [Halobacteriales archaeon QS_1_68_20]|nr:MAG: pyroglutamyl-peptidase I [Halobacteriales archaeon QS_1_68_20]